MLRSTGAVALALAVSTLAGCEAGEMPSDPLADEAEPRALLDQRGDYYTIELAPAGVRGQAMRAEAFVVAPQGRTMNVAPSWPAGGTPAPVEITGTCGLTFVSPHHAITAAHCVDNIPANADVTVRIPRLRRSYDWLPDTQISGTYPNFVHPPNAAYDVDEHTCKLVVRCGDEARFGPHVGCDIGVDDVTFDAPADDDEDVQQDGDIAMLRCIEALGDRYGYVEAADALSTTTPLVMPWYHEVYDIEEGTGSSLEQKYISLVGSSIAAPEPNYHYIGGDDRHQLLPLMSTDEGARWHVRSTTPFPLQSTTLLGCHGTSGSGVMQRDAATGLPELLGPAATATTPLSSRLCFASGTPSTDGITFTGLEYTQYFATQAAVADCTADPSEYPSVLLYWLACSGWWIDFLQDIAWWNPFPECPACNVFSRFRAYQPPVALVESNASFSLGLAPQQLNKRYRASVRVYGVDMPAEVTLKVGNQVLATHVLGANDDEWVDGVPSRLLTGSFVSAVASGELTLVTKIANGQGGTIGVSDIVLVEDGRTGVFEHRDLRDGFALVTSPQAPAQAMRFAAGTSSTFAAVLQPGERMFASYQALAADRRWALVLALSETSTLSCGLMLPDGTTRTTSCSGSGITTVLDGEGAATPVGWFVDNVGQSVAVIEDASIAEVAACAHDACATGSALVAACDDCVTDICATDAYCCTTAWDAVCVSEVRTVCGSLVCPDSTGTCAHSACTTGVKLKTACDVPPLVTSCVGAICSADPYCCATAWDATCVGEVASVCQLSCD